MERTITKSSRSALGNDDLAADGVVERGDALVRRAEPHDHRLVATGLQTPIAAVPVVAGLAAASLGASLHLVLRAVAVVGLAGRRRASSGAGPVQLDARRLEHRLAVPVDAQPLQGPVDLVDELGL